MVILIRTYCKHEGDLSPIKCTPKSLILEAYRVVPINLSLVSMAFLYRSHALECSKILSLQSNYLINYGSFKEPFQLLALCKSFILKKWPQFPFPNHLDFELLPLSP